MTLREVLAELAEVAAEGCNPYRHFLTALNTGSQTAALLFGDMEACWEGAQNSRVSEEVAAQMFRLEIVDVIMEFAEIGVGD